MFVTICGGRDPVDRLPSPVRAAEEIAHRSHVRVYRHRNGGSDPRRRTRDPLASPWLIAARLAPPILGVLPSRKSAQCSFTVLPGAPAAPPSTGPGHVRRPKNSD